MARDPLIRCTASGLFCERGGFHIDPWAPVDRAVVTHGHADHARPGSGAYFGAATGLGVLRRRLGDDASIDGVPFGEPVTIGDARVSFHPAGHLLGSAQVRVEVDGEVWVVSGDYKLDPDPTCEAFEPVRCDTFVTECTFGLPIYRWRPQAEVFAEIDAWWRDNRAHGRTSVLFAYALGKAQRILAGIDASIGPVLVHGAIEKLLPAYEAAGVALPAVRHANDETARETRGAALVVAPPTDGASPWLRKFGDVSTALASGWMQIRGTRRRRSLDRGFVLSDHVDWPGLDEAVRATGASRVVLTHGYTRPAARWFAEQGYETDVFETRFEGELLAPDRDGDTT